MKIADKDPLPNFEPSGKRVKGSLRMMNRLFQKLPSEVKVVTVGATAGFAVGLAFSPEMAVILSLAGGGSSLLGIETIRDL